MQDTAALTAGDVVADDSQPDGEWLPPAAAASRLGVSERTLWRLVKAGRYHRRVVDRKAMILVPGAMSMPDTGAISGAELLPDTAHGMLSGNVSGVTDTAVLAIVDELRRQSEASLALIAQQAETIGRLTAELEAEKRAHSPGAPDLTPSVPAPTTDARVPLLARLRALAPWLLLVVLMLLVLAVGWPLAWGR